MGESSDQLAQSSDQMFVRNCGHAAKRSREVEVWIEGIPTPRIGFLAGLDEEFLQLCLTEGQTLSTVRRDLVVSMEETGRQLGKMARDGEIGEDAANRIRKQTEHFQRVAASRLAH
jgi:hypothetical protein